VRVRVVVVEIIVHCLNDRSRNLCAARPVEIGDRMAIVDAFERGEMRTNFFDRDRLAGLWFHIDREKKKRFSNQMIHFRASQIT
jgi:hypothetical protein